MCRIQWHVVVWFLIPTTQHPLHIHPMMAIGMQKCKNSKRPLKDHLQNQGSLGFSGLLLSNLLLPILSSPTRKSSLKEILTIHQYMLRLLPKSRPYQVENFLPFELAGIVKSITLFLSKHSCICCSIDAELAHMFRLFSTNNLDRFLKYKKLNGASKMFDSEQIQINLNQSINQTFQ